jgi:glutaredoxin
MKMRAALAVLFGAIAFSAFSVSAQQLYRWTDEKGRVHITDTPPPGSAKDVHKRSARGGAPAAQPQQSFELAQAMKDFPVSLYTAPNCTDPCNQARAALNKRGIPFTEIQVADRKTHDELRQIARGNDVPVLVVGRSVHEGFQQEAYDALLDAARYPKAGVLPPRAQGLKGEPVRPAEPPKPTGPYAPR